MPASKKNTVTKEEITETKDTKEPVKELCIEEETVPVCNGSIVATKPDFLTLGSLVPMSAYEKTKNYFQILNDIDVSGKTEKKNGLTYLSWAWAWGEVKKNFPDSTYHVYPQVIKTITTITENGKETTTIQETEWNYHHDGKTAWVETGVTVNGIEHIEYLPIMDNRNKSIPVGNITSFDVNKAIQRSLTKACARHGLGLYVYAGEDLPETTVEEKNKANEELDKAITQIDTIVKKMIKAGVDKTLVVDIIKEYFSVNGQPSANYKAITDIEVAKKILLTLNNKKETK